MLSNAITYLSNFKKKITTSFLLLAQSSVIKNFFIYSFGSLFLRGIALVLAPITLTLLSPTDYGLFSLVTSFTTIFMVFLGLGLRQVFALEYFHHDETNQKKIINDILAIYSIVSIPFLCIAAFNIPSINGFIFVHAASTRLIAYSLMFCFISFFVELYYQVLQYKGHALHLTMLQIAVALSIIILNLSFLFLGMGIEGMILGQLTSTFIALFVSVRGYFQYDYFASFDLKNACRNFSYYIKLGLPFIPSVLFGWLLSSGDRWVLARYATLHDVGIYSIADAFSQLFYMLVLYPLGGSYIPMILQKFAQNKEQLLEIEQWNRKIMYISMIGTIAAITIGYFLCKPLLYIFLPAKYHEAIRYILFILLGDIFWMGTYFSSALIQYHKKSYFLALALCIPALLNVALNILFIPYFNIYGCVGATVISYITYFGITLWYNNRLQNKINNAKPLC